VTFDKVERTWVDLGVEIEPMPDNPATIACRVDLMKVSAEFHASKV